MEVFKLAKSSEEIVMENLKTIEEWALQGMTQKKWQNA